MARREVGISLPPHIDRLLDELAARSSLTRSEIVRQGVLLIAVTVENKANPTAYLNSIRKMFGVEQISG